MKTLFKTNIALIHPSNENLCTFISFIQNRVNEKDSEYLAGKVSITKSYSDKDGDYWGSFIIESNNPRATVREIKAKLKEFLSKLETYKPTRYYTLHTVNYHDKYYGNHYTTSALYDYENNCVYVSNFKAYSDDYYNADKFASQFCKANEYPKINQFSKYETKRETKQYNTAFNNESCKIFKSGKKFLIAKPYTLDCLRGLLDENGNYK